MYQEKVFHHYFINSCFSSMIRGYADYFHNELFPRSKEIVIASYTKAVQHWLQRKTEAGEKMSPKYPFLTLDPMYDFEPDPQSGRFLWRYPNFSGNLSMSLFKPAIYEDDNILLAPILNRYRGRMDLIVWCSSPYELMDVRHLFLSTFGGLDRPIYPKTIDGYIIIPDELLFYTYENPYDGQSYTIDWENNGSQVVLLKNINKNKMVYPFEFRPYIKMTDIGDGSDKYGGGTGDELSDYRINVGLEWEADIPSYLGLQAVKRPEYSDKLYQGDSRQIKMFLDMDVGFNYFADFDKDDGTTVRYSLPDMEIQTFASEQLDEYGEKDVKIWSEDVYYKEKYSYIITQEDEDNINSDPPVDFSVTILDDIEDAYRIKILGKFGELYRDYHWYVSAPGVITFRSFQLETIHAGDVIYIAVYTDTPEDQEEEEEEDEYDEEGYRIEDDDALFLVQPDKVLYFYDTVKQFETTIINGNIYFNLSSSGWTLNSDVITGSQTEIIKDYDNGIACLAQDGQIRLKLDSNLKEISVNSAVQELYDCIIPKFPVIIPPDIEEYGGFPEGASYPSLNFEGDWSLPASWEDFGSMIPISTVAELQLIGNDAGYPLTGSYYLTNDIDLTGVDFTPIGFVDDLYDPGKQTTQSFRGIFNGCGYSIKNLTYNNSSIWGVGLFGFLLNAIIVKLGVENVNITAGQAVGALSGIFVGTTAVIMGCFSTGTITGENAVGGLLGSNPSSVDLQVTNCWSSVDITTELGGGGLIGHTVGMCDDCFSYGLVVDSSEYGDANVGGLIGTDNDQSTVTNSYWDIATSGQETSAGDEEYRSTGQLYREEFYTGWDFINIWSIPSVSGIKIGIYTLEGLAKIGVEDAWPADDDYILMNNIDASDTTTWDGGKGWTPICPSWGPEKFTGTFDGNQKTISNLFIERIGTGNSAYIGLFGIINGATIQNLTMTAPNISFHSDGGCICGVAENSTITNCHIINASVLVEVTYAGGICGELGESGDNGTISHCTVSGTITADNDTLSVGSVGGITGWNGPEGGGTEHSIIEKCYSSMNIEGTDGTDLGDAGTFVGYNSSRGEIYNCYANGNVTGNYNLGGFVGQNTGLIENCYSLGTAEGAGDNIGGFVGYNPGSGTETSCYWNTDLSENTSTGGDALGKTTLEMKTESTYDGWNFTTIWDMCDECGEEYVVETDFETFFRYPSSYYDDFKSWLVIKNDEIYLLFR